MVLIQFIVFYIHPYIDYQSYYVHDFLWQNSTNFANLNSVDFESQRLIASLIAEEEQHNDDGLQPSQVHKRRLIQIKDDDGDDDSEIEITHSRRKSANVNKSKRNTFQPTHDDGRGKSSQLNKRKTRQLDNHNVDGEPNKRSIVDADKRKKKIFEAGSSQPTKEKRKKVNYEDESDDGKEKAAGQKIQKESKQRSDVWDDFVVVTKKTVSKK
ncbi:hypothetical protein N665_0861s0007 [Sinapis alba]|nr:hypothetical protein N665_0861s0007 [Sinapis alba]